MDKFKELEQLLKQKKENELALFNKYIECCSNNHHILYINLVALEFNISPLDIISNKKNEIIVAARMVYCLLMTNKKHKVIYISKKINKSNGTITNLKQKMYHIREGDLRRVIYNKILKATNG